jgi:WD40 repeat protein
VRNARGVSGKGVMVSTCSFSHDGKLVCAGTEDGTLQMWSLSAGGGKSRPHKTVRKAHSFGEITSVAVAPNGHSVASRSFDGTLKVWDLRKFTKPVAEFGGLDNFISETDALFSPSGRYIMTGTSVYNKDTKEVGPDGRVKIVKAATHEQTGAGKLVFVDATSLQIVREVEYPGVSVLRIRWHPRLNQIFVSDGGGNCSVHYTKGLSQKGALFCANKAVAKKTWNSAMVAEVAPDIRNPHALPMFKDEWQKKQQVRAGSIRIPAVRAHHPGAALPLLISGSLWLPNPSRTSAAPLGRRLRRRRRRLCAPRGCDGELPP